MLQILVLLQFFGEVKLLNNGLALTPPMGWMSWGYYMCIVDCDKYPDNCLNEKLILSVTDEFYTKGYQEAGYEYIIIDDCWSEKKRNNLGMLVPDPVRFPRGMKYVADYIHSKGLKFGLYASAGQKTCMGYPGSRNNLELDAKTFASWDVDYVKFDGCFVDEAYLNRAYIQFGLYLNQTGRPMVYSCSWPYYIEHIYNHMPNYTAVGTYCNLWRNYHDVVYSWKSVKNIIRHYEREYQRMGSYMGPEKWNDPDMLVVGSNMLTEGQNRIQLSVYAMLSAPLIFSCDMKRITESEKKLLQNQNLIAIAQDHLGIQAIPYQIPNSPITLWVKRHLPMKGNQYHSFSLAFVNMSNKTAEIEIRPGKYGLNSTDDYTVMDIFEGSFLMNITLQSTIHVPVPPEDVVFYALFPL